MGFSISFLIYNLIRWKRKFQNAKDIIYEIILYRKETALPALAFRLSLPLDIVYEIIQSYIKQNKIIGEIKGNIFINYIKKTPVCPICKEEIIDPINLIVCPFCRKPFHKDHLLKFLKEEESICPNCRKSLNLADLYLQE